MNIHEALDTRFDRPGNLDTLVIGAGLAGLISAHEAARAGLRVAVVEGGPVGGRARTTTRAGFALNQGPHAVYDTGELAGALARFGVTVTGGSPNDLVGMVVDRGVLHRLPVAPKDLLTTQVLGARGRAGFARLFAGLSRGDASRFRGVSVDDWLASRSSDLARLVRTLVRTTTYCSATDLLSAEATILQLRRVIAGVTYVDGGWQHLVDQLRVGLDRAGVPVVRARPRRSVPFPTVGRSTSARRLDHRSDRGPRGGEPGRGVLADRVRHAGRRAGRRGGLPDLLLDRPADELGVGLEWRCTARPTRPSRPAPDGHGLVSVMRYLGAGEDPEDPGTEQDRLVRFAAFAGVEPASIRDRRYLHRMTVAHGMPVAASGGLLGRPEVRVGPAGLFRAGDWVGETGMLADASAASATRAAVEAVAHCAKVDA
ncbi:MAG: FAD-binding protein [Ilumatobacteraceae bacterium]